MTDDGPWLNVPQAVVLEATHDIDLVRDLSAETTTLLIIKASRRVALVKASRRLARRPVIPPEADIGTGQGGDAREQFHEAKTTLWPDYLEAQQEVHKRLVAGVKTKARRRPGGPYESVDPVEYIGTKLQGIDAVDKRTGAVILFDLLVDLIGYAEHLTAKRIRPVDTGPSRAPLQVQEQASREIEKWQHTGDPVPKLIGWARSRWGEDLNKLPNRIELLRRFREQFGMVSGINEKTMRSVRLHLAAPEARRGGARMHRR